MRDVPCAAEEVFDVDGKGKSGRDASWQANGSCDMGFRGGNVVDDDRNSLSPMSRHDPRYKIPRHTMLGIPDASVCGTEIKTVASAAMSNRTSDSSIFSNVVSSVGLLANSILVGLREYDAPSSSMVASSTWNCIPAGPDRRSIAFEISFRPV